MTGSGREKATILVADDDPDILRVTAAILNRYDYEVLTANTAEVALKAFEETTQTIHLVISDLTMPGMNGTQLVHSLKRLSPSMPSLVMSGSWENAPDSITASIGKPFHVPAFLSIVMELLAHCDFAQIALEQSMARSRRLMAVPAERATK